MTKFYDHTDYPSPGSRGTSEGARAEFQKIELGFDLVEITKADKSEIPDASVIEADIAALQTGKENASNKSNTDADSESTTKFPVWAAVVAYFSADRIRTLLGISTLSGSNTGDETTETIQSKRPLKTVNGTSLEGVGNVTVASEVTLGKNKFTDAQDFANAVNVASASTVDLNAMTANTGTLTGTTTITAWTLSDGAFRRLRCPAGIQLTYNATTNNLNTGGANYTTQEGDELHITAFGATIDVQIIPQSGLPVTSPLNATNDPTFASTSSTQPTSAQWVNGRIPVALNATGSAPLYACRAWVNFNGTGTVAIRASGNVSSITDNGVGDYTVNFATAMPDANYAFAFSAERGNGVQMVSNASLAESLRLRVFGTSGTGGLDTDLVSVSIFR